MAKKKRGFLLVFLFLCGVVGFILYISMWMLQTAWNQAQSDIEQNLKTSASKQTSLVMVWYGSIENNIKSLINLDILRLFASEIESSNISARALRAVLNPNEKISQDEKESLSKSFEDRVPEFQKMIDEFLRHNDFVEVSLVNTNGEIFLSTEKLNTISKEQKDIISYVLKNKVWRITPIRKKEKELVFDIVSPIFAPQYIDQSGSHVVGVFLGTCSVQKVVSAVDQNESNGFFTSAILDPLNGKYELIDPLFPGGRRKLSFEWKVNKNLIPMEIRNVPTRAEKNERAYTIALPVEGLPWFVMQGIRVQPAEGAYIRFRNNIYLGSAILIFVAVVFVLIFWWWGIGRRERAVAKQMSQLYMVASEQKQILDSVNSALSSAIVLNDLSGKIYYVNQKFADLAKMNAEAMIGINYTQLPNDLAQGILQDTVALSKDPRLTNCTRTIADRQYMVSCSPCVDDEDYLSGIVSVYNDITELIEAQKKAENVVKQTVNAFIHAIEAIDPYLQGQSAGISYLSIRLVQMLGHSDSDTVETLRIAASLCQIGMIQLPRELLLKTGFLSKEERFEMQKHVEYARKTLEGIDFGLPVVQAITQMYERMDGSGYPKHLLGDQICFNARILSVANTFCALMRPRSYRTAHSVASALDILKKEPFQYDQEIVNALQSFLNTEEGHLFVKQLSEGKSIMPA